MPEPTHLSGWQQIPWGATYDTLWERFESAYRFRPSTKAQDWPAIVEPSGSVTFDLAPIFTGPGAGFVVGQAAVNGLVAVAFARAFAQHVLTVLDWQHAAYRFEPSASTAAPHEWPVPPFPNGDYYIFLTEDMQAGTFGHPWEQTLCVFGSDLVQILTPTLSPWLPIRRDCR